MIGSILKKRLKLMLFRWFWVNIMKKCSLFFFCNLVPASRHARSSLSTPLRTSFLQVPIFWIFWKNQKFNLMLVVALHGKLKDHFSRRESHFDTNFQQINIRPIWKIKSTFATRLRFLRVILPELSSSNKAKILAMPSLDSLSPSLDVIWSRNLIHPHEIEILKLAKFIKCFIKFWTNSWNWCDFDGLEQAKMIFQLFEFDVCVAAVEAGDHMENRGVLGFESKNKCEKKGFEIYFLWKIRGLNDEFGCFD